MGTLGGQMRGAIPVKGQPHLPTPKLHPRSQVCVGTTPAPSQKPNRLSGCLNQSSRTIPGQLCLVFVFASQKP